MLGIAYVLMHYHEIVATLSHDFRVWGVALPQRLPLGFHITDHLELEALLNNEAFNSLSSLDPSSLVPFNILDAYAPIFSKLNQNRDQLINWLQNRVLTLSRENAKEIHQFAVLPQSEAEHTRAETSLRFYAVSVTDGYWIKKADDPITWDTINPRKLTPNLGLALVALSNQTSATMVNELNQLTDATAAAEISVLGTFPKGCFKAEDELYILKRDRRATDHGIYAEILAYQLLSATNVYGVWPYQLDDGTGSGLFPATGVKSTYCRLMNDDIQDIIMAGELLETAESLALEQFPQQFAQMVVIDYLIGNIDRHEWNWGFYRDNVTGRVTGLHPLYDHNLAFKPVEYFQGLTLPMSAYGRTHGKSSRTLKEGAFALKDVAQLQFTQPIYAHWFDALFEDRYSPQDYLQEFLKRCESLGINVICH